MHNLGTVISFEVVRALKKKSFWVMVFVFPIAIALIFTIVFFSNQATNEAVEKLAKQEFSVGVTDQSGLVKPSLLQEIGAKDIKDKQVGIEHVKQGTLDGYIYYPADLKTDKIEVYGNNVNIFENGRYSGLANYMLERSVDQTVPATTKLVIQGNTTMQVTTFRDGQEFDPFKQMILPGLFLVLFYFLIAFFGNQMLTSTTEEKENRVVEMLFTTVSAYTMIIGKIIALNILAVIQGLLVAAPALIGYIVLQDKLDLIGLDFASLPVDAAAITLGALFMIFSLLMFTGFLVFVGALVPTAKEAGQFFGIFMILIFGPLYAASLFISAPDSSVVTFLTLFPLTAPIPLMLRNAVGNLETWEALVGLLLLVVTTAIIMVMAVRAFRFGALEYDRRLPLKEIFGRR